MVFILTRKLPFELLLQPAYDPLFLGKRSNPWNEQNSPAYCRSASEEEGRCQQGKGAKWPLNLKCEECRTKSKQDRHEPKTQPIPLLSRNFASPDYLLVDFHGLLVRPPNDLRLTRRNENSPPQQLRGET